MKSRSVSVTGATGFVGWHIAERFRDAGWDVRGLARPDSRNPLPADVRRVQARLTAADLAPAFDGSDLVIHSAARLRGPSTFAEVNVGATREVVTAANTSGARLIFISSQAAAGPSAPGRPVREDDPPRPITDYGRSKLDAEAVVRRDARVSWTILRPSSVYGPRDRQFLPLFRLASRGRFLVASSPDARFTLVHVHDVARAVALAAEADAADAETFFVGHPQPASNLDVLRAIAAAVGRPMRPTFLPPTFVTLAAYAGEIGWRLGATPLVDRARLAEFRAGSFVCSTERAAERIGFTAAIPLDKGFGATWEWYQKNGWA